MAELAVQGKIKSEDLETDERGQVVVAEKREDGVVQLLVRPGTNLDTTKLYGNLEKALGLGDKVVFDNGDVHIEATKKTKASSS